MSCDLKCPSCGSDSAEHNGLAGYDATLTCLSCGFHFGAVGDDEVDDSSWMTDEEIASCVD